MSVPGAVPAENERRFLDTAISIGEQLCDEAIWSGDRCTWIGDTLELVDGDWEVVQATCGGDLYEGTAGIACFLAHLFQATGNERARSTCEAALRQAIALTEDLEPLGRLALYTGATGVAWACSEIGITLGSQELLDAGRDLAERLASEALESERFEEDGFDLLAGTAGTALGLLAIGALLEREDLVSRALELGRRLVASSRRSAFGVSWGDDSGAPDLCGLAHGSSGVALALLEIAAATGVDALREVAAESARYERCWFNELESNWADLRDIEPSSLSHGEPLSYPAFWCNGAVGIGLARLRAHQLTGERRPLAEAAAAMQAAYRAAQRATARPYSEIDFSLCHGLAGIAELFLYAYQVLRVEEHLTAARWIGDFGISTAAESGLWPCGVPGGGETQALMLGLAGIGLCYLRLHDPDLTSGATLILGGPA